MPENTYAVLIGLIRATRLAHPVICEGHTHYEMHSVPSSLCRYKPLLQHRILNVPHTRISSYSVSLKLFFFVEEPLK